MAKIYELTTNGKDGYKKYYVVGLNNDTKARKLAKRTFGKYYWTSGISYYDRTEDAKIGGRDKYWTSPAEFSKLKRRYKNYI